MDGGARSDAADVAVAARAVLAAVAGGEEGRRAGRDDLPDLAVQRVVGIVDLVVGELLDRRDADEAVAVVGQVRGPVDPTVVEDGLEHRQRAAR